MSLTPRADACYLSNGTTFRYLRQNGQFCTANGTVFRYSLLSVEQLCRNRWI